MSVKIGVPCEGCGNERVEIPIGVARFNHDRTRLLFECPSGHQASWRVQSPEWRRQLLKEGVRTTCIPRQRTRETARRTA